MTVSTKEAASRFKIGAVARLAGVSVHTIRKWEERYGAVSPQRSEGGGRVYTRDDVERLVLIKKLADSGHALRDLATLSLVDLTQAWRQVPGADIPAVDEEVPIRTAILGSVAAATLTRFGDELGQLELVAVGSDLSALSNTLGGEPVDLLLFETPMLSAHTDAAVHAALEAVGCDYALVLYNFASRNDVMKTRSPWVATLKLPADAGAISRAIAGLMRRPMPAQGTAGEALEDDIRPPRIAREALARFAASAPVIECECPNHLADLVMALRAFEEYSMQCANQSAEDAALHQYLWRCAARSRALFEDAVEYVAQSEGLTLD